METGRMYVHALPPLPAPRHLLRFDHATVASHDHLGAGQRHEHHHDVYHVVLYTAGAGSALVLGEEVPVRAPWLVLVSPGQPHSFQGARGDDTRYSEATFSGTDRHGRILRLSWPELLRERFGCVCPVSLSAPVEPETAAAIAAAIRELAVTMHDGGAFLPQLVDGLLAHLLLVVFRALVAAPAAERAGDALERARALIDARVGDPPSLDELARSVGLSAKHLTRAFKRRYGEPPVAYRRRAAMEQAATLVRSSRLPLSEIAARLGFEDQPYFHRVFRQIHGESPGRFRRRHLGGSGDGL